MKLIILYLLAFVGGVCLAVQAGFNSQLGMLLKHPVLAVVATSVCSVVFGTALFLFTGKGHVPVSLASHIPWYLWFSGGLFSMVGISLYFFTIPRLGISRMIVLGLCGQVVFSLIAGKYGWLNLPVEPLTTRKLLGAAIMIIGIMLINTK